MKNDFPRVPYGSTVHGEEEIESVIEVLRNSTQMGPKVELFEQKIASLFEKKYGLMTNSGSSALYLAMEVANMPRESEVITPALTFSTTVASLVKNGFIPSFVDVKRNSYCIDVNKIEEKISKKTKGILAPDLLGNICEWDKIREIADKHDLFTPYESPLKQFRAYRFHPCFKQDVAGGLKSKTYSHKVDPMQELCRFETAGGICNDPTCDFQHFRDIDLPGAWVVS